MSARHSERRLELEVRAAEALREALKTITDDEEAIADTVEGETNLHEAIAAVLNDIGEDETMASAITERMATLDQRRSRILHRVGARRSAIERAMSIAELQKLELPEATLSLRKVAPGVEVYDESVVPDIFFDQQAPRINKARIKNALGLHPQVEVPGARLTNGSVGLTIRRA